MREGASEEVLCSVGERRPWGPGEAGCVEKAVVAVAREDKAVQDVLKTSALATND